THRPGGRRPRRPSRRWALQSANAVLHEGPRLPVRSCEGKELDGRCGAARFFGDPGLRKLSAIPGYCGGESRQPEANRNHRQPEELHASTSRDRAGHERDLMVAALSPWILHYGLELHAEGYHDRVLQPRRLG